MDWIIMLPLIAVAALMAAVPVLHDTGSTD
jgi:hypothetical protein